MEFEVRKMLVFFSLILACVNFGNSFVLESSSLDVIRGKNVRCSDVRKGRC